jgi:hypothetical protein
LKFEFAKFKLEFDEFKLERAAIINGNGKVILRNGALKDKRRELVFECATPKDRSGEFKFKRGVPKDSCHAFILPNARFKLQFPPCVDRTEVDLPGAQAVMTAQKWCVPGHPLELQSLPRVRRLRRCRRFAASASLRLAIIVGGICVHLRNLKMIRLSLFEVAITATRTGGGSGRRGGVGVARSSQ